LVDSLKSKAVWVELRVACPPEAETAVSEAVADYLVTTLGAGGVVLGQGSVSAYFPEAQAGEKAKMLRGYLASLRRALPEAGPIRLRRRRLVERDWGAAWKKRFKALRIGRRLLVRPSWRATRAKPGEVVIEIDPGQAFGTGSHASTALALEAIEAASEEFLEGLRAALDLGCGTGILAIALAKLGWPRVAAVDIDPDAVEAARDNVARNGVAEAVAVEQIAGLGDIGGPFELVAANLSRTDLLALKSEVAALCRPGAALILSGLLAEQAGEVEAAYLGAGFSRVRALSFGGWSCLVLSAPRAEAGGRS
jgi:ribosomal protein L11 methyltransferase